MLVFLVEDVGVRPVRCAEFFVVVVHLLRTVGVRGEGRGRVADVHDGTEVLRVGELVPVNGARVPEDEVAGFGTHFDELAAAVFEPSDLVLFEPEPVDGSPGAAADLFGEGLEELLVQGVGALHHEETAVVRAVGCEVEDALDALHSFADGVLVDVGPGLAGWDTCSTRREREVQPVKGNEELFGTPYFGEGVDETGFGACIPQHLLVLAVVAVVHSALDVVG